MCDRPLCTNIYQAGKWRNAVKEMKRLKINVLDMSEVRWPVNGITKTDGAMIYYLSSRSLDPNHRYGVAIMIHKSINKSVNNFVPYSHRCAILQLIGVVPLTLTSSKFTHQYRIKAMKNRRILLTSRRNYVWCKKTQT